MVYEWDEKRARRAHWARISLIGLATIAALCLSAWLAVALEIGI